MSDVAEPEAPESKCGTYAGYNAHMYYGEPTCVSCRRAASDYQRNRRKATGNVNGARYNRARQKALTKLARRYETEFQKLLVVELRADR
jgi:hypothetical protein